MSNNVNRILLFGRHLDLYQSFISCLVETRNYSVLSLAFIASSFRVTEENLVFETVQSGPYSSLNVFSALKGTHIYILLVLIVPVPCYCLSLKLSGKPDVKF